MPNCGLGSMSTLRLHDCCPALFVDEAKNHKCHKNSFQRICLQKLSLFHLNALSAFNKNKQALRICKYFCTDWLKKDGSVVSINRQKAKQASEHGKSAYALKKSE